MSARLRRVGILGHAGRPGVRRAAARLAVMGARCGCVVRMFQNPTRPCGRSLQAKLGWQGSERRSL
jgi:hypothetical protein